MKNILKTIFFGSILFTLSNTSNATSPCGNTSGWGCGPEGRSKCPIRPCTEADYKRHEEMKRTQQAALQAQKKRSTRKYSNKKITGIPQ